MLLSSRFPVSHQPKAILARVCVLHLLLLTLLLLPLQLQAGIVTCENCQAIYDGDKFSSCPSCHPESTLQPSPTDDEFQQSQQLAIQLFTLAAQAQPDSNFVFSPDSLFQALSLVLQGATGATQEMLENFLRGTGRCHLPSPATSGATPEQEDEYSVGNCLLLADRHELLAAYREKLKSINAMVHDRLDFNNMESLEKLARELNSYFCERTNGMIPSVCDAKQWSSNTALSIINSVYFKGVWKTQFYRKESGWDFILSDGEKVHLKRFLHQELNFSQYATQNEWQAVTVPYQGDHEMVLVLPPEGAALSEVSPDIITNLFGALQSVGSIDVQLPAFETSSETVLNSVLESTDLRCLFQSGGVSLGNMLVGSSEAVFLSDVRQRCVIKVNEKGTEASAVTQTEFFDGPGSGLNINFNRPFLYILRHKVTGRMLFIGQVLHPEVLD